MSLQGTFPGTSCDHLNGGQRPSAGSCRVQGDRRDGTAGCPQAGADPERRGLQGDRWQERSVPQKSHSRGAALPIPSRSPVPGHRDTVGTGWGALPWHN